MRARRTENEVGVSLYNQMIPSEFSESLVKTCEWEPSKG